MEVEGERELLSGGERMLDTKANKQHDTSRSCPLFSSPHAHYLRAKNTKLPPFSLFATLTLIFFSPHIHNLYFNTSRLRALSYTAFRNTELQRHTRTR